MKGQDSLPLPAHLDLLWPRAGMQQRDAGWLELAMSAGEQRLRPLLHIRSREQGWPVTSDIAEQWEKSYRRSAMRSLKQKAELVRIIRWLSEAGIPAIVLKGGAIVWRGWIDPALRPMRDLDILVPKAQAAQAHQLLRSRGFIGDPDDTARAQDKHLPGLIAPETGVLVEIHTRLIDAKSSRWEQHDELFVALASARARQLDVQNYTFSVFGDEDILLHVIAHAVLDHQFNNGPLALLDMDLLIRKGEVNWTNFWSAAGQTELMRSSQLALRLVETVIPDLHVDWQGHLPNNLDDKAITGAAHLMFVPYEQRTELGFLGRLMRFAWSEQPKILLNNWLHRSRISDSTQETPPASLRNRVANMGSKAGRAHIKQSLDVAKWLRK